MVWNPSQHGTCQVQQLPSREGFGLLNSVDPLMRNNVAPTTRGAQSPSSHVSSAPSRPQLVMWLFWSHARILSLARTWSHTRMSSHENWGISFLGLKWSAKSCNHLWSCKRVCPLRVGRLPFREVRPMGAEDLYTCGGCSSSGETWGDCGSFPTCHQLLYPNTVGGNQRAEAPAGTGSFLREVGF